MRQILTPTPSPIISTRASSSTGTRASPGAVPSPCHAVLGRSIRAWEQYVCQVHYWVPSPMPSLIPSLVYVSAFGRNDYVCSFTSLHFASFHPSHIFDPPFTTSFYLLCQGAMPSSASRRGLGPGPSGLSGCGGGVDEDHFGLGRVSREDQSHRHSHSHGQQRYHPYQQYGLGLGSGLGSGFGFGLGLDVLDDAKEAARAMLYLQSDQPTTSSSFSASSASSSSSSSSSFSAVYDRDNVTLLEHCYDDPSNAWTKKGLGQGSGPGQGLGQGPGSEYDMGEGMLAEDDTMVVLDRLRDLTTRTLHLQVWLNI